MPCLLGNKISMHHHPKQTKFRLLLASMVEVHTQSDSLYLQRSVFSCQVQLGFKISLTEWTNFHLRLAWIADEDLVRECPWLCPWSFAPQNLAAVVALRTRQRCMSSVAQICMDKCNTSVQNYMCSTYPGWLKHIEQVLTKEQGLLCVTHWHTHITLFLW